MNIDIYKQLHQRILFIEYEPGQILKEQTLAKEFGVSRTPLRTVLFRLEWEQLIKILPRTGVQVAELELTRIMNVYEARLELEEVVGRLAAERFAPHHFESLDGLLKDCDRLFDHKDPKALAAIDFSIKALFLDAAGNPYLKEMSDRLYALTFRLWYFNMVKMNGKTWKIEVTALKKELSEMSTLLAQNNPMNIGIAHKKHLLDHIERIRSQFLGLSGNSYTYQKN
ncbi:MAG: GntR family transcriptional regulator [Desulfosarcina sp.]|nr:GntR family transcriptional regulator [Desulfosarcina sp.]MBC2743665.1 GntR family transcriptional regulator [Desulfosarcina sp.]MBC2766574.1 GntR family transcriptional regulator [Desulfosarcina sp.]